MIKKILISWIVVAIAIAIVAAIVPSVEIDGGPFALIIVSAIVGLIEALLGPLLRLVSLPVTVATFGLFSLVINGVLLAIAAGLTDRLNVGGPIGVIVAAALLSLLTLVLDKTVGKSLAS